MSERTLSQLSADAKAAFEQQLWFEAGNCLVEARARFEQPEGKAIRQGSDGRLVIASYKPVLNDQGEVYGYTSEIVSEEEVSS